MRRRFASCDAVVRAWADSAYGCRAIKQSGLMNVCWLAPRPGRVSRSQLLARLDSLRIDSVPSPVRPKMATDAWVSTAGERGRTDLAPSPFSSPATHQNINQRDA
jgi:hypothetical protein